MKILITGANGLLGRYLVDSLSQEHEVFALVKNEKEVKFKLNKNINLIEMDLTNINESLFPKNLDAIYYLAQSNRFREFPDGIDDMLSINVVAPNKIAKWAVKNGVKKFVHASSGGVYTNPNKPVKEFFDIDANEKLGFYLNSKLSSEMLLKNYANLFETFVIIRPFFIYGKGQNNTMLIPRLIKSVADGKEIILNGENGITINPIYVTDAAKSASKILNLKGEHIINIAGNEIISLKELCIMIGNIIEKEPIFKFSDSIQNDLIANNIVMCNNLISPVVNLADGIRKMEHR